MSTPDLVLVDGSYLMFASFYAMPKLSSPSGHPTGALRGVLNTLKKFQGKFPGVPMVAAFDSKGGTYRNELFPDYKANRTQMPEELALQIKPLHQLMTALGMGPICEVGMEADDLIGALAKQYAKQGKRVLILTADKDFAQLLDANTTIQHPFKDELWTLENIQTRFGVLAHQIIDYLALVGDSADNIPGIPSVGPKTAAKWLQSYGTIEGILDALGAHHQKPLKGASAEALKANQDKLPLYRKLVTMNTDQAPPLPDLTPDPVLAKHLSQTFALNARDFLPWMASLEGVETGELGLDKPVSEKAGQAPAAPSPKAKGTEAPASLAPEAPASISIPASLQSPEHPGDAPASAKLYLALLWQQKHPYLRISFSTGQTYAPMPLDHLPTWLTPAWLESYSGAALSLSHLMRTWLGMGLPAFDLKGYDCLSLMQYLVSVGQVGSMEKGFELAEDAALPSMFVGLHEHLSEALEKDEKLKHLYDQLERPLLETLLRMEQKGVKLDIDCLAKQAREAKTELANLESEAFQLAGEAFKLSSPKQVGYILFEKLGLVGTGQKTSQGQASTPEAVLLTMEKQHPLVPIILKHRALSKLSSTYLNALPALVKGGRIHTHFNQTVVITGRLSSSEPNLQNVPIRTARGRAIRHAFVPSEGQTLLAADYSQIELRLMAHFSNDEHLIEAFNQDLDIHQATAASVFQKKLEQVSSDERRQAKAINFGLIYGMGSFGLAKQLGCSVAEAKRFIEHYFAQYPKVAQYMAQSKREATERGYTETLWGRRLYLSAVPGSKSAHERLAINAPLQGTAADLIKQAMITLDQKLQADPSLGSLLLQVHDELVLETTRADALSACTKEIMEGVAQLAVPLKVNLGLGKHWGESH